LEDSLSEPIGSVAAGTRWIQMFAPTCLDRSGAKKTFQARCGTRCAEKKRTSRYDEPPSSLVGKARYFPHTSAFSMDLPRDRIRRPCRFDVMFSDRSWQRKLAAQLT